MKRWKKWVLGSGIGWNTFACCVCVFAETSQLHCPCAAMARHISYCSPCPTLWCDLFHRCSEGIHLLLISLCHLPVASLWGCAMHRQSRWWRRERMLLLHEFGTFLLSLLTRIVCFSCWNCQYLFPLPHSKKRLGDAGQFPETWWGARRLIACFETTEKTMCASAPLLLASLFIGLFLSCGREEKKKHQMLRKPARTLMLTEVKGGDGCCSV